jgi:general secretion pathway protein L
MADWLLLRLPREGEDSATWLVTDARGAPLAAPEAGTLALAAPRAAGKRVCVLVSGTDVLLADPELPAKAGVKLQQLAPYALEEHLADDVERLHFAIGKRTTDAVRTPVAVVARALLDEWLATLRAADIEAEIMYADSDLLPENPGSAIALLEADAVFVRPPGEMPVTLPADALGEALEIARAGTRGGEANPRGLILYTGAEEWQRHSAQVEAARAHFEGIKVQLLTGGPLTLFAQQLASDTPINLLQGAYAPTNARAVGVRAWRVAAALLGALVALHVVGKVTELQVLKKRERAVDASIRDVFHSAMPGVQSTTDARRRMEARLTAARGASQGLLPALQALVMARDVTPGTSVQAITYRDGTLDLKLSAHDAASLERVGENLRSRGWQANLTGGNNVADGYEGHMQVKASGS